MLSFDRKKRFAEFALATAESNTSEAAPTVIASLVTSEPKEAYNRFVEDGYGLIVDNSAVEEEIDFSPDHEAERCRDFSGFHMEATSRPMAFLFLSLATARKAGCPPRRSAPAILDMPALKQ